LLIRVWAARSIGRWFSGPGYWEHVEVRGDQIGVAALVQAGEHAVAHGFERDSQERADQRSAEGREWLPHPAE